MAIYSTNQNRQLFVAKAFKDLNASTPEVLSAKGDIGVKVKDGKMYFMYQTADGALRSDMIQLKNLDYAKALKASDMVTVMKKYEVTETSNLIAGQDYVLGINIRNFCGAGDDTVYYKDAAVHVTTAMSKSDFYKAMVKELNLAFSREVGASRYSNPLFTFKVYDSTSTSEKEEAAFDNSVVATKIIIEEKPQEWALGTHRQEGVFFDIQKGIVFDGSDDVLWGTITNVTPAKSSAVVGTNAIGNGHQIADLEWFCMGERGDQYRLMGYPNYIETEYMVEPDKEYNALELHYAFTDTGVNSYRSEKDITIVVPVGASGHEYDVINGIIGAINTLAGTSIATLS